MSSPFTPITGIGSTSMSPIDMKLSPSLETKDNDKQGNSFASLFANALNAANDSQWKAGDMSEALATGTMKSTHEMSIAGAKAEVMLHITTQIASKLSSAATQLFQMQL